MENPQTQLRRILAGQVRCNVAGKPIVIRRPTPDEVCEADALADELRYELSFVSLDEDRLLEKLMDIGLWTEEQENRLNQIPTSIEAIKIEAWESYLKFAGKRVDRCRKQLKKITMEWYELANQRHAYDYLLADGAVSVFRIEYLLQCQVDLSIVGNIFMLKTLLNEYYANQMSEEEMRELSKQQCVRTRWSCSNNFIEGPVAYWTNEQVSLVNWLKLYDNVSQHMDAPPQDVIDDDLLIDGWLIAQGRKSEKDRKERLGEGHSKQSNKPGIHEVYIPAETQDDAKRIHDMNDPQTRFQKRQREKIIATQGKVDETQMPDSQLIMRQQALQSMMDRAKDNRRK